MHCLNKQAAAGSDSCKEHTRIQRRRAAGDEHAQKATGILIHSQAAPAQDACLTQRVREVLGCVGEQQRRTADGKLQSRDRL